jgi:guanylate kinase
MTCANLLWSWDKEVQMDGNGYLIVISGPSGVGKGTVIRELMRLSGNYVVSVSVTSREPRVGEEEGVHYFFISKPEFEKMIENGQFIEWDVYVGNFYGSSKPFVSRLISEGKDVVFDITYKGAFEIKEKHPDSVLIFILPPSIEELKRRLETRVTESAEAVERRLDRAKTEMEYRSRFDYQIINDDAKEAACKIDEILHNKKTENANIEKAKKEGALTI